MSTLTAPSRRQFLAASLPGAAALALAPAALASPQRLSHAMAQEATTTASALLPEIVNAVKDALASLAWAKQALQDFATAKEEETENVDNEEWENRAGYLARPAEGDAYFAGMATTELLRIVPEAADFQMGEPIVPPGMCVHPGNWEHTELAMLSIRRAMRHLDTITGLTHSELEERHVEDDRLDALNLAAWSIRVILEMHESMLDCEMIDPGEDDDPLQFQPCDAAARDQHFLNRRDFDRYGPSHKPA